MQSRLALTAFSFGLLAACGPHDVDLGGSTGVGVAGSGGDAIMTGGTTGGSLAAGGTGGTATGGMPDGSGGVGVGGGPAEQFCGNGIIEPPELCDDGMLPVMCPADCGVSASGGAGGGTSTGGAGGSMPDGSGGLGGSMATGGGPAMGGTGGTDGSECFAEVVLEGMGVCADNDVLLARGYERCASLGSVLNSIHFPEPCAASQSYSIVIECCPPSGAGGSSSTGGTSSMAGTTGVPMSGGTGGQPVE